MTEREFRRLQREAGVERNQCPVCTSTACTPEYCEDCGTEFAEIDL